MKHAGGCHCGAVSYEVEIDLEKDVLSCNCSHCQMKGFLLSFVPAGSFCLLSGEENLTEYRFNTGRIAHLFCATCGVESFARGKDAEGNDTIAINARCLEGVDPEELTVQKVNGRDF